MCFSQTIFSKVQYQLESGVYISTSNQTPFWLRSNQYGIVPLESQFLTVRGAVHKEYDSTKNEQNKLKKFDYGYGVSSAVNVGKKSNLFIPEVYLKVRYGAFEIYGGRRKEVVGLVDTTLTSGSYIWSGNALPMPKFQISIPNYTSIIGHGLISIKGAFAHGWFDNGYVKNYYLHQKWIYGRIGKPNWRVKFYAGFNHQVQWGGEPAKSYVEAGTGALISKFPSDFATYLKVVSGVSLNKNDSGTDTGIPLNEAWNRAGNHLGTLDIATEVTLKNIDLFLYRQSIYEDGSLFYLNNIADGLFGFSIKRKNIQKGLTKVCFEYLNTTSQGGSTGSENTIPQLRGQDSYFNNSLYLDAWAYNQNIIGTPLMTPLSQIDKVLISKYSYGDVPQTYIVNNRVNGFNISLHGKAPKMNFTTKLMWTNNLGLYSLRFAAKQFSFLQQINYQLPQYTLVAKLSIDRGQLFTNNLGCYFGVRRIFL
ncbi:capsule assembly Wzi family protein [Emticicia sp.]|uniref:capsule assembly Wzi family protein n=1 Tax=Emticicia sp. TaxID=1930953 RepID=UPI003752344D